MDVSKGIREMMVKRGRLHSVVAEDVGCTKQSFSRMLKTGVNKIDTLQRIAASMDYAVIITLKDQLGDEDVIIK